MADKHEIAKWLLDRILAQQTVYQYEAVADIEQEFGEEWVYMNDNGNPAIHKGVLTEFRKMKPDNIEWDRRDRSWSVW